MDETGLARSLLQAARRIKADAARQVRASPSEVAPPPDQPVLPHSLFQATRGYIEKVVHQINRSYTGTCYDACAVMIRRLVEVLIIEAFEHRSLSSKVLDANGNFLRLEDLVRVALAEPSWTLGRSTKSALAKLKTIGDQSAHSRRYNARREYIDQIVVDLRVAAEELLYLAGLRR
jgi:hypothetical protein